MPGGGAGWRGCRGVVRVCDGGGGEKKIMRPDNRLIARPLQDWGESAPIPVFFALWYFVYLEDSSTLLSELFLHVQRPSVGLE